MKLAPSQPKKKSIFAHVSCALLLSANLAYAEDSGDTQGSLEEISRYLKNMGLYFGYNLNDYCTGDSCSGSNTASSGASGSGPSNQLTNSASTYANQIDLFTSFLGALLPSVPVKANNTNEATKFQLISSTNHSLSAYSALVNSLGNKSFSEQSKSYTSPDSGAFSVSSLIDQQPYQTDPVNQAILNMLSTPDVSYCVNVITGALTSPCNTGATIGPDGTLQNNASFGGGPVLSQLQIGINTIGAFRTGSAAISSYPATGFFALPKENVDLAPQLNSDSLLGPLMFDNGGDTQNSGSNNQANNSKSGEGLTAKSQIEQAANYIRYASGAVVPPTLPNKQQYGALYADATNQTNDVPLKRQLQAQATIANYLSTLRIYAAQTSVGISNLYSILSRRMPQKSYATNNQQTSQALSEYNMATWRLQPPTQNAEGSNQTWTTQINAASSATVQKEIAILLAEINYQLYLSRVQQERLLLTNSTLLLQGARGSMPNSDLQNQNPAANTENSAGANSESP